MGSDRDVQGGCHFRKAADEAKPGLLAWPDRQPLPPGGISCRAIKPVSTIRCDGGTFASPAFSHSLYSSRARDNRGAAAGPGLAMARTEYCRSLHDCCRRITTDEHSREGGRGFG